MDIIFNNPLVHALDPAKGSENNKRDMMAFDLKDTIVTFNNEDFLLVTRLWPTPNSACAMRVECI